MPMSARDGIRMTTADAYLDGDGVPPNLTIWSRTQVAEVVLDGQPTRWPLARAPFLLETSRPGVFAAGDVRLASMKRVASAVGEGSTAVSLVHMYLETV